MSKQKYYENTYKIPITKFVFENLYKISNKNASYEEWLAKRSKSVNKLYFFERDLWTLLSGNINRKFEKIDEIKIADIISKEKSIRNITLLSQVINNPKLQAIKLSDVRLAHPLELEKVPSQQKKFTQRCEQLSIWKYKKLDTLSFEEMERIMPSSDPLIITRDPLNENKYVAATGNGRMAALKKELGDNYYIEAISFI